MVFVSTDVIRAAEDALAMIRAQDEALARVVGVVAAKGGVFKSSLAANMAVLAAANGNRVLLVDLDKQSDIGHDLGYVGDPRLDQGTMLATAAVMGTELKPLLTGVREYPESGGRLDVIPGGTFLADVAVTLAVRASRKKESDGFGLLAKSLAKLAPDYDLVIVDTPPSDESLSLIALKASRWLIIPTKPDSASIADIEDVAVQIAEATADGHALDILGVVLTGMSRSATRVRAEAAAEIRALLGDAAPLFDGTIRDTIQAARATRRDGVVAHELAEKTVGKDVFWDEVRRLAEARAAAAEAVSQNGESPEAGEEAGADATGADLDTAEAPGLKGPIPGLAFDYVFTVNQAFNRITELEQTQGVA